MALVERHRYDQGAAPQPRPLTDFTFWAGAGFSKSWDPNAPIGNELFSLSRADLRGPIDSNDFARLRGVDDEEITLDGIRQIVYQLDMYERYPDVQSRYIDPQSIKMFRAALRAAVLRRYDRLTTLNYFDPAIQKFSTHPLSDNQKSILRFVGSLQRHIDGSGRFIEGIKCHFVTTNYDYIIETILDRIILDPDDSVFLYTYRGFTPSRIAGLRNSSVTHHHGLTQHLIKLNGGFEILRIDDRYVLDYSNRTLEQIIDQPPIIMLPSREQDYTDPYFREIFPKVVRLMRDTTILMLIGYSLPEDDALMRFILRQFAEEPEDARRKVIFYIDPMSRQSKLRKLRMIFPSMETSNAPQVVTFEGSFVDFATECVSLMKSRRRII
jgi:hypothetical protein